MERYRYADTVSIPFFPLLLPSCLYVAWSLTPLCFLSCGFRAQAPEWVTLQQLINSDGRIIEELGESQIKAL